MAFNFNWSPLATDASFYQRAKELLTNALNRAGPRPAIIVDDFLVSEFNLGDVPPDLEIVEIGDLATDKFRGTFKMRYQGDAVLSLKTKVQANPLNTYLVTRPSWGTPQPLAADTGLTIPLQITLSEIRLSGFIILVFSHQKGLTIVFKDDPLESLRVSSTFDSIPFVANYLQKEIETQLRNLLMDELPAIIHRLSLRFWAPEHKASDESGIQSPIPPKDNTVVDPLAGPPQDPVDSSGNVLSPAEVASLSLDSSVETQSLFSQKNLIRLATLSDSHRTLSLFTPSIRDAVFRAWTGPLERGEMTAFQSPRIMSPALSRVHSHTGSLSTFAGESSISRPSLYSFPSTGQSTFGGNRLGKNRKRKKRVVNLRTKPEANEVETTIEDGSTVTDSASVTESTSEPPSIFSAPPATASSGLIKERDLSPSEGSHDFARKHVKERRISSLPERSAAVSDQVEFASLNKVVDQFAAERELQQFDKDSTLRARRRQPPAMLADLDATPRASLYVSEEKGPVQPQQKRAPGPFPEKPNPDPTPSTPPLPNFLQSLNESTSSGSIAERAWMMKMANEMTRRYEVERAKGHFGPSSQHSDDISPPPAYTR